MNASNHSLLANVILANRAPRFASLTYTAKGTGEVARHTLRLGASVEAAYKKDIETLSRLAPKLGGVDAQACAELLASLRESVEKGVGNNSAYTCADTYVNVTRGVKVHKETGEVHVTGFTRSKVVLEEGTYKSVKSSEKTIARNKLRKGLLSGKFRQFVLPNVESARLNGNTLTM